jgi:hypothetical protein
MEFGAISETLPEPPRGTNAWFFHNPQISRSQSTTEYLLVAASKVTATMATAWDRIDETYRSYLTGSSISTLEFNELPATERAALRNVFLLQQQQQQQQQNGELRFCFRIHCCIQFGVASNTEILLYSYIISTPCRGNPPEQPVQQLPAEAVDGLIALAHDYIAKKRTIVLSEATSSAKDGLLDMLKVPETGASWPNKPAILEEFPGFEWLTSNEDSPENRTAYMSHLTTHVRLPADYLMKDVQPNRTLLNVQLRGIEESHSIKGTTDVVIAESKNIQNDAVRNSVEALLELKKPKNLQNKDHNPQTICEHLAASYLNASHGVVSVLTDLNRSWTFYWYAENKGGSGVALYKLKLEDEEEPARLAKYILESLNNESRRETLPTTFVDRLSFQAVADKINEEHESKRARRDFGGGGGSFQTQDGKPAGRGHQPPPSGPGSNSSSGMEFQNNDNAGDGNRTMDMARALRRFAPHSNSDVANELDLLDMVDETEQYEIVRSFAAKHIVPFMTGQTL